MNASFRADIFDIQVAKIVDGKFLQNGNQWMQAEDESGQTAQEQCVEPLRPGGPACEFEVRYINASGGSRAAFEFALRAQPGSTPSPELLNALRFDFALVGGGYSVTNQTWEQMQTFRSIQGADTLAPWETLAANVRVRIPIIERSPVQDWTLLADKTLRTGNGNCLDDPSGGANGVQVLSYQCHGYANQQWTYDSATKSIKNVSSGKCLAWGFVGHVVNSPMVVWTCDGTLSQQFELPGLRMKNAAGEELVVTGGNSNSGATLQKDIVSAGPSKLQSWRLWPDGTVRSANGNCVDDPSASSGAGTRLVAYSCHGGANQRWSYTASTGALKNEATGRCMAWDAAGHVAGTALVSWACNNSPSQKFLLPDLLTLSSAGAVLAVQSTTSSLPLTLREPDGITGLGLNGSSLITQLQARATAK
ncbi:RICIN domain-containing protein [Leucobacter chromiireducens]|uniref:RICIN domain-containing protein n=1 Tax=Leucobacter chromiireducens TaxID=283877 RepID=UPI0019D0DF57|nr:RICIN domain-containing protein [Leucobacter chromiireducens]